MNSSTETYSSTLPSCGDDHDHRRHAVQPPQARVIPGDTTRAGTRPGFNSAAFSPTISISSWYGSRQFGGDDQDLHLAPIAPSNGLHLGEHGVVVRAVGHADVDIELARPPGSC